MTRSKNFYLTIWSKINKGKSLKQIAQELNISKQNLNYHLRPLKELHYIERVGYGTWQISKQYDQREVDKHFKLVKKTERIDTSQVQEFKTKKEIRGHAFQIKLELPKNYKNWEKRESIFQKINLEYKEHYIGGINRGQRMTINGKKVHLFNKSIVVNLDESYLSGTARESKFYAIVDFLKIIKKLERMFNNSSLEQHGKYKIKVTRQHYSIVKNALAGQYLTQKRKLYCYTGRGLWLLIDNSYNLEELETLHPDTADEDNEKVQTVFNNIKEENIETLKEMSHSNIKRELTELKGVFPAMAEYNKNLMLHIEVQQAQLKTAIENQETQQRIKHSIGELTKLIKEMRGQK